MKNNQGISLIEVLLGAAAMGIIGTIIVTIMVNGSGVLFSQNTQINQSLSLNNVNSKIHVSIKNASTITASYINGSSSFTSTSSTIIFQVPSIAANGNAIDGKFDTMVITTDPENLKLLKKYVFPDISSSRKSGSELMVNNLSKIQFVYLNSSGAVVNPTTATTIDYVINISEKSSYGVKESSSSGRVNLKNN